MTVLHTSLSKFFCLYLCSVFSFLLHSSAVQFFKTLRRKLRSAGVTAKSPVVRRQRDLTNHCQNLVCIALPYTIEDKIACQLHFHCQGSLAKRSLKSNYVHQGDRWIDSMRHRVRRHTCQESSHILRKFLTISVIHSHYHSPSTEI